MKNNLLKSIAQKIFQIINSNIVLIALLIYFYILCVDLRFITGDEGYFAYASKAILDGKVPYKDFFFPQAFLHPYFLASFNYVIGESWQAFRLFSAIIATGIGALLFDIIRKKSNTFNAALGVIIYITSDLVIGYFTIIKNYSLSVFFMLLALRVYESKFRYKFFIIGFLLSIVFQIRSYFVVCELVFIAFIFLCNSKKLIKSNFYMLLLGNFIGILPSLYMLFSYFDEFIFNNLTYHSLRNRAGLITGFHQKFNTFCSFFHGVKNTGDISIQFILLFCMMFIKKFDLKNIYFYLTCILFIISFLPTPVFSQYFSVVVPFLIIYLFTNNESYLNKQVYKFLTNIILAIYIINFFVEVQRYAFNGINVSGIYIKKNPTLWRPKNLDAQIENIASRLYFKEGKGSLKVFSSWPGYLIGMKAKSVKGLENHFARNIAHKLSKEDLIKYKVYYSENDLSNLISNKNYKYLILGYRDKKRNWQRLARKSGYKYTNYKIIKFLY